MLKNTPRFLIISSIFPQLSALEHAAWQRAPGAQVAHSAAVSGWPRSEQAPDVAAAGLTSQVNAVPSSLEAASRV
jgi:hypothetical protein